MSMKNSMQLKALVKNKAAAKGLSSSLVLQNYMMERLLERISRSKYRQNFILKGGFLIGSIVGLDARATMDIDATMQGFPLTHESVRTLFDEVCAIVIEDDVTFAVSRITDIRESDDYPGMRIGLVANYPPMKVPLTVDVTAGDRITPRAVEYSFRLLFEERSIPVLAYNLETLLAEKLETVLSRNVANTRPRDFYDIHVLFALHGSSVRLDVLKAALEATTTKRGSQSVLPQYRRIIDSVRSSPNLLEFWKNYQREFLYARGISFDEACDSILQIMDNLESPPGLR